MSSLLRSTWLLGFLAAFIGGPVICRAQVPTARLAGVRPLVSESQRQRPASPTISPSVPPVIAQSIALPLLEDPRIATGPHIQLISEPPLPPKPPEPPEVELMEPWLADRIPNGFCPDPSYEALPYDAQSQIGVYEGKKCVPTQRPWLELGRGLYRFGEIPPSSTIPFGATNLTMPTFLIYGDFRTAAAYNDNGGSNGENFQIAHRLNLDFDLKLTATERIHAFWGPLDEGGKFTRLEIDNDDIRLQTEFDENFDTLFFEGDVGAIWGGMSDQWTPFDLPFVAGKYPLLLQNGIWMVDAVQGVAWSVISRNSPLLNWSNFDVTGFVGLDDVDSPAFGNIDNLANVYGVTSFIDAYGGYVEVGYALLHDTTNAGLSYHNIGLAFTRRYFERVSNSIRVIVNAGQSPANGPQTADGVVVLLENALVSSNPVFFVPYCNLFAGFDTPQSVARAAGTGGILVNTGINFETDGLTGYPTLDDTANNTYGGALGFNLLGPNFAWQTILEVATVQTFGNANLRRAVADQYAIGARVQVPLNNAWLIRFDTMYGLLEDANDIGGARMELRWKF